MSATTADPAPPVPPSQGSPPAPIPSGSSANNRFRLDSQFVAPILITAILLVAQIGYGVLEGFPKTLVAITCAIVTEVVLSLIVYRKFPHLASAYITGISVGILVRSPLYWPFALGAVISIISKYVLRIKDRHIWNPSNFGISTLLFLAPATVASLSIQWGNAIAPLAVVWLLGSVIIYRLQRFHICATYIVSFVLFAYLRSALPGHHPAGLEPAFLSEVAPITGPMYQLFIFFMITDPKSTVRARWAQSVTAFCVAAAECIFRIAGNVHAPYFALFIVGPIANLIEIAVNAKRSAAAGARASVQV